MKFRNVARSLTPEVYQIFKRAVEIGRWPDGGGLSVDQKEICMQAIIEYESDMPESQRTGFISSRVESCSTKNKGGTDLLNWRD
ncbi:MAG: PA-phosphatase [Porticoccaceae bacterium]|nr:PA-phosphatase [Porticoccaceae bacterium]|tara:strand:+ start:952 stop:1203 length:252 start_codon:yes stop_codon:yes gene_type:complete